MKLEWEYQVVKTGISLAIYMCPVDLMIWDSVSRSGDTEIQFS